MHLKQIIVAVLVMISSTSAMAYNIYPIPRNIEYTESSINIGTRVNIVTSSGEAKYVSRLKEVLDKAGIDYSESSESMQGVVDVYIGEYGSGDVADIYAASLTDLDRSIFPSTSGRYDPHILRVDADGDRGAILLLGDEEGSAYYGCASLEQMFEQEPLDKMPTVKISDFAHARYRGIMEGFYGHPYTMESRLNLLEYCKRYKMNYYGYGPKADPYHAGNWRLEYPTTVTDQQRNLGQMSASDMATIAKKAKDCNVDFVWIIHPSLGSYSINLSWVPEIMTKFEHLYDLGVRHFGVSVDDMSGHPSNQGELAHQVQLAIDEKWNTEGAGDADRVGPVLFTPTVYALNYGSTYVLRSMSTIDSKIDIAFTGYDCFSNVRAESFSTMANYIGRDPVFWWNNPVNDDYDEFLYLHGLTARWFIEQKAAVSHMKGFLLNPMNQGQASKVCLFSGADYAWNPEAFDAETSWMASLQSIVKTDENVQALRDFISVMSAYVTRDTKTPEGEEYAELYTRFKECLSNISENGPESLSQVDELYVIMSRTVAACDHLCTLADSGDDDCRLFFNDIEPWLRKLREMASIIVDVFDVYRGEVNYDRWADVCNITARAAAIHTGYDISVLEGSGTGTYEKFKEVQPTPKHLDALIDFIAQQKISISLPERDRTPAVISNFTDSYTPGEIDVNEDATEVSLTDYGPGFDWAPGLFLGINLNRLQSICVDEIKASEEFSALQLQYSVNGKLWIDAPADKSERFDAAYIRYVNADKSSQFVAAGGEIRIPLSVLRKKESSSGELNITASTNMGTYSTYVLDNILDDNPSTFYWSSSAPKAGSYIMLNFGTVLEVSGVTMQFNDSDQPSGIVKVQTSEDGSIWSDKATFTRSDIVNKKYATIFSGVDAQYVRMYISTVTTNEWLQIADFSATVALRNEGENTAEALAVAIDYQQKGVKVLDDRDLATGYEAEGAGYLNYKFTENLKIEEVLVFHNSTFSGDASYPSISLYADGEWYNCGVLKDACTHIGTAEMFNIEQLKIEWTANNLPNIFEIMPVGEPFDANKHAEISTIITDEKTGVKIETAAGKVHIEATEPISAVSIYDISGRVLESVNGIAEMQVAVRLPISSQAVIIVRVEMANGDVCTKRVAVIL